MKLLIFSCLSLVLGIIFGCTDPTDGLYFYFQTKCRNDTCQIDIQEVLGQRFDTMYVFNEYTLEDAIRKITGIENYNETNHLLPEGFLVEDGHSKVILVANHQVVFDRDYDNNLIRFIGGIEIKSSIMFDGDTLECFATIYTSPIFEVWNKRNKNQERFIVNSAGY